MRHILTFSILFQCTLIYAGLDSTKFRVVKQMDDEWIIYNKKYSSYVYYSGTINKNTHIINQWLQVEKYKNYLFSFEAYPELGLFVNNKLVYQNNTDSTSQVYIPISQFFQYQPKGNALITFYNPNFKLPVKATFIVTKSTLKSLTEKKTGYMIKKRNAQGLLSPYMLVFLFIIFLVAILRNRYNKRFNEFMGFKSVLENTWLEEISTLNLLSMPLLILIIINSLYLSIITSLAGVTYQFLALFSIRLPYRIFNQLVICTIIFSIIFFSKYFFLLFVGWIFNLYKVVKIQFLEFAKGFLKINTLLTGVLLVVIFYYNSTNLPVLKFLTYALSTVLILVTIRTALLIIKLGAYRNIYLFSYLCTTELIPLTIIIKIILFRSN